MGGKLSARRYFRRKRWVEGQGSEDGVGGGFVHESSLGPSRRPPSLIQVSATRPLSVMRMCGSTTPLLSTRKGRENVPLASPAADIDAVLRFKRDDAPARMRSDREPGLRRLGRTCDAGRGRELLRRANRLAIGDGTFDVAPTFCSRREPSDVQLARSVEREGWLRTAGRDDQRAIDTRVPVENTRPRFRCAAPRRDG